MHWKTLAALLIGYLGLAGGRAHADPNGGTVSGAIELPAPHQRRERPTYNQGFVRRIKGPLKEPRGLDQRPEMVIVLWGGPVDAEDAKPLKRTLQYTLVGESFESEVFPYVAGTRVELKNVTEGSPRLYAVGAADAIEAGPIDRGGTRPVKAPEAALGSMEIRARDSAHIRGRLVALPHNYYSLVEGDGQYTIKGVPAGDWTIRVWWNGGWLESVESKISVAAGKPVKAPTIKLPVELKVVGEAGDK